MLRITRFIGPRLNFHRVLATAVLPVYFRLLQGGYQISNRNLSSIHSAKTSMDLSMNSKISEGEERPEDEMPAENIGPVVKAEDIEVKEEPKLESAAAGPTTENPYAYLDRDEFTSEHFKIEVKGLPKYYGYKEIKKLLNNKLQLNAHKIVPPRIGIGSGYMFVSFRTEPERQKALEALNGYKWKNKVLTAVLAKAAEDPLVRKRNHEAMKEGPSGFEEDESVEDRIKRVTTPWWNIPYPEQLQKKTEATDILVTELTNRILEVNPALMVDKSNRICPIDEILPSPVMDHYRNKCEFTIGYHPVTNEKMVGFRLSSYKKGSVAIGPVDHLMHLPKKMVQGALAFQDFVRSSNLDPFNPETNSGCWRQLTIRTTSEYVMFILQINSKEFSAEKVESIKLELKESFSSLEVPKINSFYLKMLEAHGQQHKNAPELLFGEDHITESLLGLQFRISPEAFFQVNVKATEVLYSTVGSLLESNMETTVLDVCCGTGTIGLSVANKCGQVLGIEMVQSAVVDARKNAEVNKLSDKCEFFDGRAEDIIDIIIGKAKFENIVAIVDPPRAGLHQRVLLLIRKCEKIKSLIYVSCDARAAMKNLVDLTRPVSKTFRGAPFIPKRIIPVDLFPHCHHHELVLLYERCPTDESSP